MHYLKYILLKLINASIAIKTKTRLLSLVTILSYNFTVNIVIIFLTGYTSANYKL